MNSPQVLFSPEAKYLYTQMLVLPDTWFTVDMAFGVLHHNGFLPGDSNSIPWVQARQFMDELVMAGVVCRRTGDYDSEYRCRTALDIANGVYHVR